MMVSGIYSIKNKKNGKIYIGQSVNITPRWWDHKKLLRKEKHPNDHLQSAWNMYGEESFEFIIIEECDESQLDEKEKFWILHFNSNDKKYGYNNSIGGDFNPMKSSYIANKVSKKLKGRSFSEEHRKNLSKAHKGKKLSKKHRENMSKAHLENNPWKGQKHEKSSKLKMSKRKNTSGFYNVTKQNEPTCKQGFTWRYLYQENGKNRKLTSINLFKLKLKVLENELDWIIIDENLARKTCEEYGIDFEKIK